jgi:mannose/fructose-specific phosphotransferase system component IIA
MVGILLLTHAPLGQAFIEAATHIFRNPPAQVEAIDVVADQDPEEVRRLAGEAIGRINDGGGVLVITDVMGARPRTAPYRYAFRVKLKSLQASACPCCCVRSRIATTRWM